MTYTVLRGHFVIRYPDLPTQGPEPDGDTIKFRPDTPGLVETIPRPSGRPPDLNARGISVRLEAIDALETHFAETHQDLAGANAARDALLARLGFTNVVYFPDQPNRVQSADADELVGYVLSNGIDANGRLIGFVYPGVPTAADGASVFLDDAGVDRTVNASLLADGLVYPAFYGTLPAALRTHLAVSSRAARAAGLGIWPGSTATPDSTATVPDLATLETFAIWPKLFRRLVPYLATGATSLDGFDSWLRADPVNRDDALFFLDRGESGNLHDLVVASGHRVHLNEWPEDFIIEPDPPSPGTPVRPGTYVAGDVVIVAALPDPVGSRRRRGARNPGEHDGRHRRSGRLAARRLGRPAADPLGHGRQRRADHRHPQRWRAATQRRRLTDPVRRHRADHRSRDVRRRSKARTYRRLPPGR